MAKRSELITVILFCVIIGVLAVLFVVIPDREFSEQENRTLAQTPELDVSGYYEKIKNSDPDAFRYVLEDVKTFNSDINVYYSDQFPFRDLFVKIKSGTELMFLKGENNGVLYSNGQLAVKDFNSYKSRTHIIKDTDRIFPETIEAQLKSVDRLGNTLYDKQGIKLVTVIPPRTVDIADSAFDYDRPDGDLAFELMNANLGDKAGYIDVLSLLRPKYESGEYVYYKTDHHWTTLGAYYVYCEIMKELGVEDKIIPQSEFDIEQINDFSGTTAARANFPFYQKDVLELWHLDDDNEYEVIADGENIGGFYNRSYLETSDKYSVFIDGTHAVTEIKKQGENRKTLLVSKDSFANSLIPFLAREFNIVALDLRINSAVSAAATQYNADAVLIVYNTENIITTANLGNVR